MAFSKSKLYQKEDQAVSLYAKALGHPARLAILLQLALEGESSVENITRHHPLSQAAMSDHLGILRRAGMINYEERFPYTFYRLDKKNQEQAEKYIGDFFQKIKVLKKQKRQKARQH
jgi:ArsR family transcriptional regulator